MLLLAGLKRGATLQTIPSPPPPGERLRGDGGEMEQIVQVGLKIHPFIIFYAIPPKLYFLPQTFPSVRNGKIITKLFLL